MTNPPSVLLRRVVLTAAFGIAVIVSGAWQSSAGDAWAADAPAKSASSGKAGDPATKAAAPGAGADAAGNAESKDAVEQHAIIVEKGGKRVRVVGIGDKDPDSDTMQDFVNKQPELAGMVVAVVAIIFLSPVLLVALVMGYRMRKARLLNETLLRLAERGAIAPAEAMQALTAGQVPAAISQAASAPGTGATTAPSLLEQARQTRHRAAWSDLRKGVIVGAVGLAFAVPDLARGRTPGTVGLILLFIGAAYAVLWWYETRHRTDGAKSDSDAA